LLFFSFGVNLDAQQEMSNAPLLDGLVAELNHLYSNQPKSAVEKAVIDGLTRAAADENVQMLDLICNRDYSLTCPTGWIDVGDGAKCSAPNNYMGKCSAQEEFGGLTPQEKSSLASRCGASFPCLGACTQDYKELCPAGWVEDVNHDCSAPNDYSGPCVGRKSFIDFNALNKASWAQMCGVEWPCGNMRQSTMETKNLRVPGVFNSDCVADFSRPCPQRFHLHKGLCQAPTDYDGTCAYLVDTRQFGSLQKAAYAKACHTPWPCVGDSSTSNFAANQAS